MKTITIDQAKEIILKSKGKIFSALFIKKNHELRNLNCRLGVTSHLKGGVKKYDAEEYGLMTVFDVRKKEYRSLNLNTLRRLKINKEEFEIV